ncbi:hypothetical protein GQ53DRAFT_664851 [Thozetella sp. PMI_491]|nr:hypothetical protein GQ53DRAFT_664851 [Thozetella sp. PMI_491]
MDLDSPSLPRLDSRVAAAAAASDPRGLPLASPDRAAHHHLLLSGLRTSRDADSRPWDTAPASFSLARPPGAASPRVNRGAADGPARREPDDAAAQAPSHPPSSSATTIITAADPRDANHPDPRARPFPRQPLPPSSSTSQETTLSHDSDRVFTPPAGDSGIAMSGGNEQGSSSQESQLLQLSQIAAAQDRMSVDDLDVATQTKRTADGVVKHTRTRSSASPVRNVGRGHSRNPSTISMASTTGSRIGELKARLSYAMVKVNNGWQGHSIDQVESLASQAASPTSSSSTVHLRSGASASPPLSGASLRSSNNSTPATGLHHHFGHNWRDSPQRHSRGSPSSPVKASPGLAPPVSIEPARPMAHPRRNSNARHTPTFLTHSQQASPNVIPNTPNQPSPYLGTPRTARTPMVDPILFSPHQNVREQDAIETLLFMSSPGNSANLKHHFPSSSQPLPSGRPSSQRTALPTSQPRKSLPNGRPSHGHSHSLSQPLKRVGFEDNEMDLDEPHGTPNGRTPKRKVNGHGHGHSHTHSHSDAHPPTPRLKQLPTSAGLTAPGRPRPVLREEDIDRMLDRADDSSDSEGEIQIPVSRARRGDLPVGA